MKAGALLDLLYPRACAGCGRAPEERERGLCWTCRADLQMIAPPLCKLCGNPVEGRIDHEYICYHCDRLRPHFDRARSAGRFDGLLRQLVLDYKYHRALWLEAELLEILSVCASVHYSPADFDTVASVPLYPARRRHRGFNQAELLASALARRLGKPCRRRGLARIRRTPTQTHLTASQRLHNVTGAFEAASDGRWRGHRVLLVDDVMTTGATVSECARALKEAGAEAVFVVTLARGV
jgi:ComF family protein